MYFDAHTHNAERRDDVLSVFNVSKDFEALHQGYCSMGLHPWFLTDETVEFEQLSKAAQQENVLAIGECGLDKICSTNWDQQVRVFRQQIELANELKKPLIIHCVRAYNELIQIIDEHRASVPVIIHGFSKKMGVAELLLAKGYILSFGAALLKSSTTAAVFKTVPPNRYLLETDDSGAAIEDIYNRAAEIRETGIDSIILQAGNNFKTVFKV